MISVYEQRELCSRFVRDALNTSNMSVEDFVAACGIKNAHQMNDYLRGSVCPTVSRIMIMHKLTGLRPDDYGMPLIRGEQLVEEMRSYVRCGHSQAEFVKATRCDKNIINALINGGSVTMNSVYKFVEGWQKYNVPTLINDPEFAEMLIRKGPVTRSDKELRWIKQIWGGLAESAKQIREGFWVWFSESLYKLELEHISDDLYEFRGIFNATGDVSTRREVHIA